MHRISENGAQRHGAQNGAGGLGLGRLGLGLGLTDRFNQRGRFLQHPAAAACSTAGRGAAANDPMTVVIGHI